MTFQHENRDHPKRMWSQEARISVYLVDSAKVNTFRSAQVIFKTTPVCSTAVMSIWCLHIYSFRGVSHWLSVSNCRKFIHRFPLNAVEQSEIIFIFPSFVTITENSDLRRRSWPDKSLCWSFMVRQLKRTVADCCVFVPADRLVVSHGRYITLSPAGWQHCLCHSLSLATADRVPECLCPCRPLPSLWLSLLAFSSLSVCHRFSSLPPPRTFLCLLEQHCRDSCQHFSAAGQRLSSSVPLIYRALCTEP